MGIRCFEAEKCIFVETVQSLLIFNGKNLVDPFSGCILTQYSGLELNPGKQATLSDDGRMLLSEDGFCFMDQVID